jgi:hypothetical protein
MEEERDINLDEEPEAPPRQTARYVGVVLGLLGICAVIVAGVFGAKYFEAAIAPFLGDKPFEITLNEAEVEAELDRLRALPGAPLPADLGAIADARVACATQLLADRASDKAKAAAARYFVILFAARRQAQSPLVNPLFLESAASGGVERKALRQFLQTGVVGAGAAEGLAAAAKEYRAISHPLYAGLDLEHTSWAQSDLERILLAASTDTERLADCTRKRVGG